MTHWITASLTNATARQRPVLCALLLTAGLAAMSAPAMADVTRCDTLAGHPLDPRKVALGVNFLDINVRLALAACQAAVIADARDPRLRFELGRVLERSGDYAAAVKAYQIAAEANYAAAQNALGAMYQDGLGVTADSNQAQAWFKRSADQGYQPAVAALVAMDGLRQTPERVGAPEAAPAPSNAQAPPPPATPTASEQLSPPPHERMAAPAPPPTPPSQAAEAPATATPEPQATSREAKDAPASAPQPTPPSEQTAAPAPIVPTPAPPPPAPKAAPAFPVQAPRQEQAAVPPPASERGDVAPTPKAMPTPPVQASRQEEKAASPPGLEPAVAIAPKAALAPQPAPQQEAVAPPATPLPGAKDAVAVIEQPPPMSDLDAALTSCILPKVSGEYAPLDETQSAQLLVGKCQRQWLAWVDDCVAHGHGKEGCIKDSTVITQAAIRSFNKLATQSTKQRFNQ